MLIQSTCIRHDEALPSKALLDFALLAYALSLLDELHTLLDTPSG